MLRAITASGGDVRTRSLALNDAVVTKTARSRMIDLSVYVGDEFVTRVRADGLIIATPTGSTAYNLSAGGPIVQPNMDAMIITPIAPHTLTNRPIVIPARARFACSRRWMLETRSCSRFDGQSTFPIHASDEITVCRAPQPMRLIRPTTRSYFDVLRTKLKWGER